MQLQSVHVWNWRGLDELALEDLCPRLNLVVGPNESGKSRLFEATRFGLFEPSRGQAMHKRALQGWSSADAPRVEIRFEVQGVQYRLSKQFLKGHHTHLDGPGRTLQDEEAEAFLRQLLSLSAERTAVTRPERLGLWPLLWVAQGDSRRTPDQDLTDDGRSRLQDRLSEEIGEVVAGAQGKRILERAVEEAQRFWTQTWRESGELRAAGVRLEVAGKRLGEARARRDAARAMAEELAAVQAELDGIEPRLEERRSALAEAERTYREAQVARHRLEQREAEERRLRLEMERAEERLQQRQRLAQELTELGGERDRKRQKLIEAQRILGSLESDHSRADELVRTVSETRTRAQQDLDAAIRSTEREEVTSRLSGALGRLTRAKEINTILEDNKKQLARLPITGNAFARIASLNDELERLRVQVVAVSARLEVLARTDIAVDGETLVAGDRREWMCPSEFSVRLGEIAEIRVVPGGADVSTLHDQMADRKATLDQLLAENGVGDLVEARMRLSERDKLEKEFDRLVSELRGLAPDGLDGLTEKVNQLEARLERLPRENAGVPAVGLARSTLQKAEATLDEARSRRDALWRGVTDQRVAVEGERRESEFLGRKIDDDARELGKLPANDELRTLVAERRRAWEDSLALRETQKERWEVLGGERAEAELARERKALDSLSAHASQITAKAQELTAHLRAREAIGLHEEVQEAEVAFTESESHYVKLSRFAAAARCLVETLLAARREAQERLTAPVLERIRPYLDYVFPNSNVCINDEWTLEGLSTDDVNEPFAALSGGAQEQLGILVRLGLAELFADKERLPILLDDALINTDPSRLLAMQQALYQAADRLQIILFSCQDTSFDALAPERIYQLHSPRRGA